MLVTSIFSFSHNVFYPSQNNFKFSFMFILFSGQFFNLDQAKNMSFGKELREQEMLSRESLSLHIWTVHFNLFLYLSTKQQHFRQENLKPSIDNKLNIPQVIENISEKMKNILEKGETAGYQHLHLFPKMFSESFFFRLLLPILPLWEKEKLLVTSNFYCSHSVFYPFREPSAILIKIRIVVRKLFQYGRV